MCSSVRCARRLDTAAASSSPNCWTPGYHALPSTKSPPFPPLHAALANAPDELRAPARAESLLCRAEFRRLVRRQIQHLLDAITEPLLDLPAETSSLGGVALRARGVSLLRSERRRQQDGKAE